MLNFQDISQSTLQDASRGEAEQLNMISSKVQHNMRIPIQTIINNCFVIKAVWESFRQSLDTHRQYINPKLYVYLEMIFDEISYRHKDMSTMGNLLQLNVEDLLAFIQIKSGKFIKEIQHFNVKKAVEEITVIHK